MKRGKATRGQQHRAAKTITAVEGPLKIARTLSVLIFLHGLVMLILGGGVISGAIGSGWGFPMSSVPNWGRPWGVALLIGAGAYLAGPALLFRRPQRGSIVLLIVSSLSVAIGTPLITTTTEIAFNLFKETKIRPTWIDSIWAYYMILHVATVVALYRAYPTGTTNTSQHNV